MSLLRLDSVSVRFGGVMAVDEVSMDVPAGSVTGLIGPNGAGKTTTFNVITGLQPPSAGSVYLNDQDISKLATHRRARLGMARTFQRLEVFGSLTARENILVAAEISKGWGKAKFDPKARTDEIIELVGLSQVADDRADAMPTGLARLVELGRTLATRPRVLLLDEASSGLNENESDDLGRLLVRLAKSGLGILLVEHDIDLVMNISERIFVLDFGRIIAAGPPAQVQADKAVQEAYLGAAKETA
ncbi:MAG: ABC transporter ATP-binding protein [Acidimicrobiales bacterium]